MNRHIPPPKATKRAGGPSTARSGDVKPLTRLQERFVLEYLVDLNATQAAKRAGYTPAYASRQGPALLVDSRIQARVAELQALRAADLKVDSDFVLRRLLEEVNADAGDLYDPVTHQLKPVRSWPEVWRRGLVSTIRTTTLYGRGANRSEEIGQQVDVVLVDRARRLELLGKHIKVNAFSDKVTIGLDSPLQELFKQIAGNVIRPAEPEIRTIEHNPGELNPRDEEE
jgi:phage terminase small subunit